MWGFISTTFGELFSGLVSVFCSLCVWLIRFWVSSIVLYLSYVLTRRGSILLSAVSLDLVFGPLAEFLWGRSLLSLLPTSSHVWPPSRDSNQTTRTRVSFGAADHLGHLTDYLFFIECNDRICMVAAFKYLGLRCLAVLL